METVIESVRIDCPTCGLIMYLPSNFLASYRASGNFFYCNVGHKLNFQKPKPESPEVLGKQVEDLKKEIQELKIDKTKLIHQLEQAGL